MSGKTRRGEKSGHEDPAESTEKHGVGVVRSGLRGRWSRHVPGVHVVQRDAAAGLRAADYRQDTHEGPDGSAEYGGGGEYP